MSGHIVLIGLSGSGKTTVGRVLAERIERPFYDTDALLAARAGQPVPELLRADEARFRALEEEIVAETCARPPGVIATGGGAVLSARNRELLCEGNFVAWLHAPVSTLAERLSAGEERPLVSGPDPAARLAALQAERFELYRDCSGCILNTGVASVRETVQILHLCAVLNGVIDE